MATNKTNKTKKKKKPPKRQNRKRSFFNLFLVAAAVVLLTGVFLFVVLQPEEVPLQVQSEDVVGNDNGPSITYEETVTHVEPVIIDAGGKKGQPLSDDQGVKKDRPRIAIVIDDMGYQRKTCNGLIDLDLNLSFAFLPFGPYTRDQAYKAHRSGKDVLLHFPMEPSDPKIDPGPGAVTINMGRREIRKVFAANMAEVPFIVGINNHMGSRFTQNREAVRTFMKLIRSGEMFFLDSRTSQSSVGFTMAREMGIRTAKRNVFLDNVRDRQKIKIQLRKLLDIADRQGSAIAIGHPYPETLHALRDLRLEITRRAKVVGVKELVR
jgi:polysaccharide deacetylase 2 family uncharacterized protein YibQ